MFYWIVKGIFFPFVAVLLGLALLAPPRPSPRALAAAGAAWLFLFLPWLLFEARVGFSDLAGLRAGYLLARDGLTGVAGYPQASNMWIVGKDKAQDARAILLNGPQFGWFNPAYVYSVGLHGAGFNVIGKGVVGDDQLIVSI